MQDYILIGLGAVFGANARYLISIWAAGRWGAGFPIGTLLINVSGSFLIGAFAELVALRLSNSDGIGLLVTVGFLSGYTTFSTFLFETVALSRRGSHQSAVLYAVGSLALGLLAAGMGFALAHLLSGRIA